MGAVKRYLEELSEEMGYQGEINDAVLAEARRRSSEQPEPKPAKKMAPSVPKQVPKDREQKSG